MELQNLTLTGRYVQLETLDQETHTQGLITAIQDGELWTLPVTNVPHPDELPVFFSKAQAAYEAGEELAFATIDIASGNIAGSTRFCCIDRAHRRLEIGHTFLGKTWQKTYINTEAKYLMLQHIFEVWEFNRVTLVTDVLNHTSRNAILRLGAQKEGVLRQHMIMRNGRVRDSATFSIIKSEWPAIKARLERKLMY